MHNFALTGFENPSVMSNNMTVIDAGLDGVVYRHWCNAASLDDMAETGTPTYHIGNKGVYAPRWTLPDGVVSAVGFYAPRNPCWIFGAFGVVVHYDSSSTSGSIGWRIYVTPIQDLTVAAGSVVSITADSPAVANATTTEEFVTAEISSASQIDKQHVGVVVAVGRDGSTDTNNGDVNIYGIELVYREKRRMFGDKV